MGVPGTFNQSESNAQATEPVFVLSSKKAEREDLKSKFEIKSLNEEEDNILTFMMAIDITRFILLTMNLVLGMSGILFFAFGIIYFLNPHSLMNGAMKRQTNVETVVLYDDFFGWIGLYFATLGTVSFLAFFFGFYATSTTKTKAVLQLALLVTMITISQLVYSLTHLHPSSHLSLKTTMEKFMFRDLKEDITILNSNITMPENITWTATQLNFNCCGLNGPSDYTELSEERRTVYFYDKFKVFEVPISCCTTFKTVENAAAILDVDFENLEKCVDGHEHFYKPVGCYQVISEKIQAIKNKLFISECVISIINIYYIAFAIFDWWASNARHFII